jgi:ATP-dependent exoDNAse (exonuclease V) beta subunit
MKKSPADRAQRDRFITNLDGNFSVVASAGSGKTHAIIERIVALARHKQAAEWLPALVVVTYTNRAAAEMQQRARQSILEANLSLEVLAAFNRAFFGTIHSLCLRLLRQNGHYLGLPGRLDHLDESEDAPLWTEFIQRVATLGGGLDAAQSAALLRLAPARQLLELGRRGLVMEAASPPGPFPAFDFTSVYESVADRRSQDTVRRSQESLRRWETAWSAGAFAGAPPNCASKAKPFCAVWQGALAAITAWRRQAALCVAAGISQAYREFRLQRGVMTFADQVALAAALLKHPDAAPRIRARGYRVILDEAQDTDPTQFDVLLEITRPPEATGSWPDEPCAPPRAGHFCMVGDFQQSIYGARADLAHYRRIHDALLATRAGEQLTFSVTFRLDETAIAFVNAVFPPVLHGRERQVDFVPLSARPDVVSGQIVRFDPAPPLAELAGWKPWQKMHWEADALARWLQTAGLETLRASSWREVAVLCPRTRWLAPLRAALRDAGLNAQIQSERAIKGDSPAYAWFTALVVALAEPVNGYEIVGVLREVFGLSDHDLAVYAEGHGGRFHLTGAIGEAGPVGDALRLLTALRQRMLVLPLFSALEEMVRTVQLRERLLSLPSDQFEDPALELEELLTQGAAAEAMQTTLEGFAEVLQRGFSSARDVRGVAPDAVQIISGHKAKGSEWDAVIVPFFARGLTVRKAAFPRLLRAPQSNGLSVALDANDLDEELKADLDRKDEQELERLLYVACTRARHTLVVVDDRPLFAGKNGLPAKAQAKLLRCAIGDTNAATFEALPTALTTCAATAFQQMEKSAQSAEVRIVPLPEVVPHRVSQSRERAAHFRKRNPSALAEAALANPDAAIVALTVRPASTQPNAGQRYGTWWHNFIEQLRWTDDPAHWDEEFQAHLADSPDAALSGQEWALLRKQLTEKTELARLLTTPATVAHAEMPFLWALSESECLDGIIDLAILHPADGSWVILDWKTNRLPDGDLEALRAHYLPQLSAYWKAASEMLHAPVSAGLYSTAAGQWLPYETKDLAAAWERLRRDSEGLARALDEV